MGKVTHMENLKAIRKMRSFAKRAGQAYESARYENGVWVSYVLTAYSVRQVKSANREKLFDDAFDVIEEVENGVIKTSIQQIIDEKLAFKICTFSKKTEAGFRILRGEVLRVTSEPNSNGFDVYVLVGNANRVEKINILAEDKIRIENEQS